MNEFQADLPMHVPQATKRYVDLSALVTSLVGLVVVVAAAYLWYHFSLNRNVKAMYDYAEQCAKDDENAAAAEQFGRCVQLRPNDATARRRLAETYDLAYSKSGRVQRTIDLYQQALGAAPDDAKRPSAAGLANYCWRAGSMSPPWR